MRCFTWGDCVLLGGTVLVLSCFVKLTGLRLGCWFCSCWLLCFGTFYVDWFVLISVCLLL